MASKQDRKYSISLAGEYLVAGELLRRGVMAAVTYGNAKQADVVAFHAGRSTLVEVKSTSEPKWVLGGELPKAQANLWALVFLPLDASKSPEYFILTGAELRELLLPEYDSYMTRYRNKYGKDYSGRGVVSVRRELIGSQHRGAWHKVMDELGIDEKR
jgi:hypothetical protein